MARISPVTIVVPVYGDLPSLKGCIFSLVEHVNTSIHRVMFVNDCGPEADRLERYIQENLKGKKGYVYHRNPGNLGFVGTCNRAALELDETGNDIMLLNSDTVVTPGFLGEMAAVLHSRRDIAVVTPRTNNATLATIPLSAAKHKGIGMDRSYDIFQRMQPHMPRCHSVPVAHGFCMLIKRGVIDQHGLFDPAFGQGYGEEVDFCMRLSGHGYRSVLSNKTFVFHLEARSFTLEAKSRMLEENDRIIKHRYPDYNQTISEYVKEALRVEREAQEKADIRPYELEPDFLKRVIKRWPPLYRLAGKIYRFLRG
jgi:GT2 family glycosyltransferase